MRLSLAAVVGTVALFLPLTADASSQYRNPSSSSTSSSGARRGTTSRSKRRRTRYAVQDTGNDENFHRSVSSATWDGGNSGYSSSPYQNDYWDVEESSSSSFYDFEDVKRKRAKKKRKSNATEETERILQALERGDEEERPKRSKRKRRRKKKRTDSSLSSSPKSSKKKRRRKQKVTTPKPEGPNAPSKTSGGSQESINRTKERPLARPAFVSRTSPSATRNLPSVSGKATASTIGSSGAGRQTPQSHPDRTNWEVPSYSHKISTMMKNKKNGSQSTAPRSATTTTLLGATRTVPTSTSPSATIAEVDTTARTNVAPATTATTRSKPTTAGTQSQSSTLGSTTTPWVRKFLAGRPKDRLLPLPKDYISDNFNLAQLPPIVERIGYQAMGDDAIPVAKALQQHRLEAAASGAAPQASRSSSYPIYRRALRTILADPDTLPSEDDEGSDEDLIIPPFAIQKAAEALYLLLHARFVISPRGLEAIRHVMALDSTVFGKCPRSCCKGTGLLPYGYSNDYTSDASVPTVTTASRKEHDSCCHRYCPSCGEVWISWESKTDGCAWGPSWCHLFLLAFGSQVYAKELEAAAAASQAPAPPQPQAQPAVRSFLPRGIGMRGAANNGSGNGSDASTPEEDLSRPTPSVFGFRIHPATAFGRPFNEPSLRGGSND